MKKFIWFSMQNFTNVSVNQDSSLEHIQRAIGRQTGKMNGQTEEIQQILHFRVRVQTMILPRANNAYAIGHYYYCVKEFHQQIVRFYKCSGSNACKNFTSSFSQSCQQTTISATKLACTISQRSM